MAKNNTVQTINKGAVSNLETMLNAENVRKKLEAVLDKSASAFATTLVALVKANDRLAACDPKTVLASAMTAATMKLPINPNLGFAYIVPYKTEASFQIG